MNESNKVPMTKSTPRFLFRYLRDDANLLDALTTPYLWFSSPDSLNDPFDLTNVLDVSTSDENLVWYINKYAGKYFPEGILKLKETLQNPESKKKMMDVMQLILKAMHEAYLKRIGLCCFSFVNNSTLLWSHYSGGHTGVCLVIDAKRFIKDFSLIKINYNNALPKWNLVEGRKQWGESWEYNQNYDQVVLGTKYKEWEYEQEYRLISPNRGKHNLYPESILGVIFGAKMPMDRRNEIKEKIKNLHSNIQVIDASLEVSNGQVVVNGFDNSIENLPIGSWRYLSDPKGEFRDLSGELISNEPQTTHERTPKEPWLYKYTLKFADLSFGNDGDNLNHELDMEINKELFSKYSMNDKFLKSKTSDKTVSIKEEVADIINFSYSKMNNEEKLRIKINEELIMSWAGEPIYYVECSKGKLDIIAIGFKVIFTELIDYSHLPI